MSENRRRGARAAGRRALLKGLFGAVLLPPLGRGVPGQFVSMPCEAEPTGPAFGPGEQVLFVSVQHPGERFGTRTDAAAAPRGSNWPHRTVGAPPQPAVVAIRRKT